MFATIIWTETGDVRKGIPGVEESLLEVQRKQLPDTCFLGDLQKHEQARTGSGN